MSTYFVIYKLFQCPGTGHFEVQAENKNDAKTKFFETGIKYDYIIKVIK